MRPVKTYDRLHQHVHAWTDGEIDSLIIFGRGGTGKSHSFKDALANTPHHLFSARKTPVQVYIELHDAPELPVVFDDVSALLRDPNFLDMLKNLLETGPRTIRWGTSTRLLEGRPNAFVFSGRVLIVLNCKPDDHADVRAVLDRCDVIEFDPTKQEVISRMRQIFPEDGELIDMLAELPALPSLRTLVKARKWQQSQHLDWRAELIAECGVPDAANVLLDIMQTCPEHEWLMRFVASTNQTERSYRRHRKTADQVLACRAPGNGCPNGHEGRNLVGEDQRELATSVLMFPKQPRADAAKRASGRS